MIVLLTFINTRGLQIGKIIQNVFTSAKTLSLLALVVIGFLLGRNPEVSKANFSNLWTPQGVVQRAAGLVFPANRCRHSGVFGLFVAFCVAQVGSLFSSDAWNNITFTAGEVKNPRRNLPLSLAAGTGSGDPPLPAGQPGLPLPAAARADQERPRRPRCHGRH